MNQDQVKEKLESLNIPCDNFSLIFSGKASQKVNGLYKPADSLIIIHNKNFTNDNALIYTAFHEFTHHIVTTRGIVSGRNSHPVIFWAIFHSILKIAIDAGVYVDPYIQDTTLKTKRDEILELLRQQNELNVKLGVAYAEIEALSRGAGARIEDFYDRHARIPRKQASNTIKAQIEFDFDDIKASGSPALIDAVISQGDDAAKAGDMAASGASIQQIKAACSQGKIIDPRLYAGEEETPEEHLEKLEKKLDSEKRRIEKSTERIDTLIHEIEVLRSQLCLDFDLGEESTA